MRTSLAVYRLRLYASNAREAGSIPGQSTKIARAWCVASKIKTAKNKQKMVICKTLENINDGACMHAQLLSYVRLCDPIDCVPLQAPLSVGFSKQEYWSGLPFPSPGHLLNSGIEAMSLVSSALQVDSLITESLENTNVQVFDWT